VDYAYAGHHVKKMRRSLYLNGGTERCEELKLIDLNKLSEQLTV